VISFDPENIDELLQESVAEICRHEDFTRFLRWMQGRMGIRQRNLFAPVVKTDLSSLATMLAVAIWNVVPLPGQGFQTKEILLPARNDRCICGSGKQFKHCCGVDPMPFEMLESDMVWALVFEHVSIKMLKDALRKNQIPFLGRIQGAIAALEEDRPKKALVFLETFFASSSMNETGEDGSYALSLLLDTYDILGFTHKKIETIKHVIATAPASSLRSEAYQRLAMIRMDKGQAEEAWRSFRKAQVDSPDDFKVGLLEIQLLLAERRFDRARDRARFLAKRMEKQGVDAEFALDFLKGVAEDPRKGSLRMEFAAVQDIGVELVDLLEGLDRRPVPAYLVEELEADYSGSFSEEDPVNGMQGISPGDYVVVPPKSLWECEEKWEHVLPVNNLIFNRVSPQDFPWQPDADYDWIHFLQRYPESFDSLSILEDILQLLDLHPNRMMPGFIECVQGRTMERALTIIRQITATLPPDGHLPWIVLENRPFHRILYMHGLELLQNGEMEGFFAVAEDILKVNPGDNHGIRATLVNCYLRAGRNIQALAVCDSYPDDMLVEIMYGKVLAFYNLGKEKDAASTAEDAVKTYPLVAECLLAGKLKTPKEDREYQYSGGPVEAYRYREHMRPAWKASGNALKWLKKFVTSSR
jgi:tetratricopeptide (TPR) repeat protein